MNQSQSLPPALLPDSKNQLSKEARAKIIALNGSQPLSFFLQALGAWAVIVLAIAIVVRSHNILVSLLAIIAIATRFNIFALLIHEQVHGLGIRGKYGNLVANLLVGYPLLVTTVENYAKVHLTHHKHFFTDKDPDFLRKAGVDWTFPMNPTHLIKLFLSDLLGLSFVKLVKGKRQQPETDQKVRSLPLQYPTWIKPLYYLLLVVLLTYTHLWSVFLLYWVVPLLSVFPVIVRLGAITEHIYNLPEADLIESSPIILLSWWEKLLLPNLNFTLHVYHHYYPGIASNNLPKVHQIFQQEQLVNEEYLFHGYWSYFKYLQQNRDRNTSTDKSLSTAL